MWNHKWILISNISTNSVRKACLVELVLNFTMRDFKFSQHRRWRFKYSGTRWRVDSKIAVDISKRRTTSIFSPLLDCLYTTDWGISESETSVNIYYSTGYHIPKYSNLQNVSSIWREFPFLYKPSWISTWLCCIKWLFHEWYYHVKVHPYVQWRLPCIINDACLRS